MIETIEYKCQQCGSTINVLPSEDFEIKDIDICPKCSGWMVMQTESVRTK
jgi:DNA-directed RNA polymerase subunit RPC12/RpoP